MTDHAVGDRHGAVAVYAAAERDRISDRVGRSRFVAFDPRVLDRRPHVRVQGEVALHKDPTADRVRVVADRPARLEHRAVAGDRAVPDREARLIRPDSAGDGAASVRRLPVRLVGDDVRLVDRERAGGVDAAALGDAGDRPGGAVIGHGRAGEGEVPGVVDAPAEGDGVRAFGAPRVGAGGDRDAGLRGVVRDHAAVDRDRGAG